VKRIFIKYIFGILLILTLLIGPFLAPVKDYLAIPSEINLYTNDSEVFNLMDYGDSDHFVAKDNQEIIEFDQSSIKAKNIGQTDLNYQYKNIPLKKINVNVNEQYQVIPGGESIGVNLDTIGVLVVGFHYLDTNDEKISPGKDMGIKVGDSILEINQQPIQAISDIAPIVAEVGEKNEKLEIKYKRKNEIFTEKLTPIYDEQTDSYRIGLYIRDSAAGIGTMTFYDPLTNKYGALGHVISDVDTNEPIEIESGTIVRSKITSIQKGDSGFPGEKRASFNKNDRLLGNITKNSSFGVFGNLDIDLDTDWLTEPIPIALTDEVREGKAQILTVINDEEVEAFDIEIISAIEQKNPSTKGMILKVTDERLLDETGGIVQGMSGSPIIQNNKIVGAVTHVFVNDPTSGYGIHIEWMLNEAEIDYNKTFLSAG